MAAYLFAYNNGVLFQVFSSSKFKFEFISSFLIFIVEKSAEEPQQRNLIKCFGKELLDGIAVTDFAIFEIVFERDLRIVQRRVHFTFEINLGEVDPT